MTEYIKKDNVLNLDISMYISEGLSPTEAANMAIKNFKEFVKEIAPSDVVERKCGKWERLPLSDYFSGGFGCTACLCSSPHDFNYCPTCGADMRGD